MECRVGSLVVDKVVYSLVMREDYKETCRRLEAYNTQRKAIHKGLSYGWVVALRSAWLTPQESPVQPLVCPTPRLRDTVQN
jgi:hypothetical protein